MHGYRLPSELEKFSVQANYRKKYDKHLSAISKYSGFRVAYSSRRRKYVHVGSASASLQKKLLE